MWEYQLLNLNLKHYRKPKYLIYLENVSVVWAWPN